MGYDKALIAGKLRRWEKFLEKYRLPDWEEIPDFGLYMEQVIELLKQYLDYMPPELKDEQPITAAAINNYVRTRIMPQPRKKKYYRVHLAYLIMICSLKQSLSIAMISRMIPQGLSEEELQKLYESYVQRHRYAANYFVQQVRLSAAAILDHQDRHGAGGEQHLGTDRFGGHCRGVFPAAGGKAASAGRPRSFQRRQHRSTRIKLEKAGNSFHKRAV